MEPNSETGCKCKKSNKGCTILIIGILIALFAFSLGLIIGAVISATVLANLATFIILAVLLFILLVLQIIRVICCKDKREKNCK